MPDAWQEVDTNPAGSTVEGNPSVEAVGKIHRPPHPGGQSQVGPERAQARATITTDQGIP